MPASAIKRLFIICCLLLSATAAAAQAPSRASDENDPITLLARGTQQLEAGNVQNAIELFNRALSLNPKMAVAYQNLGVAYMQAGDNEAALRAFTESIKLTPNIPSTHYNIGRAYVLLNNKVGAMQQHYILKSIDSNLAADLLEEIPK